MKRRSFIQNTALAAFSPMLLNMLSCGIGINPGKKKKRIMVFVQLLGGNDGLNTLIPLTNYQNFIAARPNLYIPENKIIGLNGYSSLGLHPSLKGLQEMFNNNLLGFVQGVGYDDPNYSHFRSSDIYLTGSSSKDVLQTGWMGRYLETLPIKISDKPYPPAIKVGNTGTYLFLGNGMDMSMVVSESSELRKAEYEKMSTLPNNYVETQISAIREINFNTQRYADAMQDGLKSDISHSGLYPEKGVNLLADKLKIVAKLIHSGTETNSYLIDLKGFDTHDYQVDFQDKTKGVHAELLAQLSQAITCFWDDITKMGMDEEVCGVVFSEFGRRIKSNASAGTDHGSSQPFMFFGKSIHGGVLGKDPVIPENVTVFDNLPRQYDFRAVYASILRDWYQAPDDIIANVIPGNFEQLQIFKHT